METILTERKNEILIRFAGYREKTLTIDIFLHIKLVVC